MSVFKIKAKSYGGDNKDYYKLFKYFLNNNIIGIGYGNNNNGKLPGDSRSNGNTEINLLKKIKTGDYIWTKDPRTNGGKYYLGKVVKPYKKHNDEYSNKYFDVHHYVQVKWKVIGDFSENKIPIKVKNALTIQPTRPISRVNYVDEITEIIWNLLSE